MARCRANLGEAGCIVKVVIARSWIDASRGDRVGTDRWTAVFAGFGVCLAGCIFFDVVANHRGPCGN